MSKMTAREIDDTIRRIRGIISEVEELYEETLDTISGFDELENLFDSYSGFGFENLLGKGNRNNYSLGYLISELWDMKRYIKENEQ